nr:vegetative cell wall protein gp1-like [Aegilops tauschii subsp. strangulata]
MPPPPPALPTAPLPPGSLNPAPPTARSTPVPRPSSSLSRRVLPVPVNAAFRQRLPRSRSVSAIRAPRALPSLSHGASHPPVHRPHHRPRPRFLSPQSSPSTTSASPPARSDPLPYGFSTPRWRPPVLQPRRLDASTDGTGRADSPPPARDISISAVVVSPPHPLLTGAWKTFGATPSRWRTVRPLPRSSSLTRSSSEGTVVSSGAPSFGNDSDRPSFVEVFMPEGYYEAALRLAVVSIEPPSAFINATVAVQTVLARELGHLSVDVVPSSIGVMYLRFASHADREVAMQRQQRQPFLHEACALSCTARRSLGGCSSAPASVCSSLLPPSPPNSSTPRASVLHFPPSASCSRLILGSLPGASWPLCAP